MYLLLGSGESASEAKGSSSSSGSVSGESDGRPERRGTLKPLLLLLSLGLALLIDLVVEPVDFCAIPLLGFVVLEMSDVEGRGGLKALGGIVCLCRGSSAEV